MRAGWWGWCGGLVMAAALAGGCSSGTDGHIYEDGACRVVFPGTPKVDAATGPNERNRRKASLTTRHGALSITSEEVDAKGARQADEQLDLAVNAALLSVKGKARSRKKIPLATVYPGREVLVESEDGQLMMEVRLYQAKGRLYQVVAAGPAWWIESPEARGFLRSFELAGE